MKKILIGLIIIVMLYGCATGAPDENMQEEVTTPQEDESDVDMQEEAKEPEPSLPSEDKKQCTNFDIPSQNINSIDVTLFTEGLEKTDEGFKFRLIPLDNEGNIIPMTGNLQVSFWSTRETSEGRTKKDEIYTTAFYIKGENAVEDCSSKEMEIKFEKVKAAKRYNSVSEDDPGIIRFKFIRTGSQDLFDLDYNAAEFDERIFP